MRRRLNGLPFGGLMFILLGLVGQPAMSAQTQAELLVYGVHAPGEEDALNRLTVTPAFLRLDRGEQDGGYILYDRKAGVIYSVNHEDRSILVIDPPPMTDELAAMAPEIELKPLKPVEAPVVAGVKPRHWALTAGGRTCREAFVLPGTMADAVAAYGAYLEVLARQQALALTAMPAEFQDACDSAIHVYSPALLLEKGMILKAWDSGDYREELLDFRSGFAVPQDHFALPEDYSRVPMTAGF